jgi:nucleotide-binding universal stress UspA family protein
VRETVFPTKILLAVDGSEAASLAAQAAVELVSSTGSELHVVCVEEVPVTAGIYAAHGVPTPASEENRELLDEQVKQIEAMGSAAESHMRQGRPAQEIIDLSKEIGAGFIVVGNRGLSGVQRLVLGSVSESVVRYASCPVLVVRQEDHE